MLVLQDYIGGDDSLLDFREGWERGLVVSWEKVIFDYVYVLLVDEAGMFSLHRYFQVRGDWAVSVDVRDKPIGDVMERFAKNLAMFIN